MSDILFFQRLLNQSSSDNKRIRYIWWFNIGIESLWNDGKNSILPQLTNKGNLYTVNRTEQLCLLLASPNDIVIQRERPNKIIRENLKNIGISIPEIWIPKHNDSDEQLSISELILRDKNLLDKIRQMNFRDDTNEVILAPYAVTCFEEKISKETSCKLQGAPSDITSWVNSKVNARLIAKELGFSVTEGYICNNINDLNKSIQNLWKRNSNCKIVIKEAYGASGKGMFIIDNEKSVQFLLNIVKRKIKKGFFQDLIVERWYDTALDINYQIFINENGNIDYIYPKKQITSEGIYIGSEFPIKHYLTEEQNTFYKQVAMKIGNKLWHKGYRGIASIDSIITTEGDVYPVIEINGRFTLSTYISFIPDMLGNDKIYINKYYNLKSGVELSEIWEEIKEYKYSQATGEGIIIYSFVGGIQNHSNGRLFVLFASPDKEKINLYEKIMNCAIYKNGTQ